MRFLVVDDEFAALTKMTSILSNYGECEAATHGRQALSMFIQALADNKPYDLVTIDIDMPEISGLDLLRAFCTKEIAEHSTPAKKIMITADSSLGSIKTAMKNCDGFLVKPVKKQVILDKLRELGIIKETGSPAVQE